MNPVIVIPSYWARNECDARTTEPGVYDHATPLDAPEPELARCLDSLDEVRGVTRVVVLLVSNNEDEPAARERVEAICAQHPRLNPFVVSAAESWVVQAALAQISPDLDGDTVSLRGYGAIKNMGLLVAAVLGHDVVVFLDDDEIISSPDFLVDAVYGLGHMTRQDLPVIAKTGYFLNQEDSPYATNVSTAWYDRWWNKRPLFNKWMNRALNTTRISRSNILTGGCFALHAEAFTRVGFDPYITRGEDLDYLLDLRMYGFDVWFDNQWSVTHRPPNTPSRAGRFEQDVYRWIYQREKVRTANGIIGLHQVTAESLMPYPGPWLGDELDGRIAKTAFFRTLFYEEREAYLHILTQGRREAHAYAQSHAQSYLKFQTYWPQVMVELWNDEELARSLYRAQQIMSEALAHGYEQEHDAALEVAAEGSEAEDVDMLSQLPQIEEPAGGSAIPGFFPRAVAEAQPAVDAERVAREAELAAFLAEAKASAVHGVRTPYQPADKEDAGQGAEKLLESEGVSQDESTLGTLEEDLETREDALEAEEETAQEEPSAEEPAPEQPAAEAQELDEDVHAEEPVEAAEPSDELEEHSDEQPDASQDDAVPGEQTQEPEPAEQGDAEPLEPQPDESAEPQPDEPQEAPQALEAPVRENCEEPLEEEGQEEAQAPDEAPRQASAYVVPEYLQVPVLEMHVELPAFLRELEAKLGAEETAVLDRIVLNEEGRDPYLAPESEGYELIVEPSDAPAPSAGDEAIPAGEGEPLPEALQAEEARHPAVPGFLQPEDIMPTIPLSREQIEAALKRALGGMEDADAQQIMDLVVDDEVIRDAADAAQPAEDPAQEQGELAADEDSLPAAEEEAQEEEAASAEETSPQEDVAPEDLEPAEAPGQAEPCAEEAESAEPEATGESAGPEAQDESEETPVPAEAPEQPAPAQDAAPEAGSERSDESCEDDAPGDSAEGEPEEPEALEAAVEPEDTQEPAPAVPEDAAPAEADAPAEAPETLAPAEAVAAPEDAPEESAPAEAAAPAAAQEEPAAPAADDDSAAQAQEAQPRPKMPYELRRERLNAVLSEMGEPSARPARRPKVLPKPKAKTYLIKKETEITSVSVLESVAATQADVQMTPPPPQPTEFFVNDLAHDEPDAKRGDVPLVGPLDPRIEDPFAQVGPTAEALAPLEGQELPEGESASRTFPIIHPPLSLPNHPEDDV